MSREKAIDYLTNKSCLSELRLSADLALHKLSVPDQRHVEDFCSGAQTDIDIGRAQTAIDRLPLASKPIGFVN